MYKTLTYNLGREALRHIIRTYGIKQMHIPYYLCDAVRHTLVEENCKPLFYHIDDDFFPSEDFPKEDFILYPNYWGVCGNNTEKLVSIYPKLIVDNAHAYYNKPSGFACFNAGHKFGFRDSYAFINENSAKTLSYTIKEKSEIRRTEFLNLHNRFNKINLLTIDLSSIPFCYPCLVDTAENADKLAFMLKKEGKLIYRYWNALPEKYNEYKFYSRLVPIPINT